MQAMWALAAQFAYLLMLAGLFNRSLDRLRRFFIFASLCAIGFSLCAAESVLWVPLLWNCVFLLVNAYQLNESLSRQRKLWLDPIEQFLQRSVFTHFPADELKSFARVSMEGTISQGEVIVRSDSPDREVVCILKGIAEVVENGRTLGEVKAGRLVGVLAYVCGYGGCDVVASTELKVLVWTGYAIDRWVGGDPARLALIQSAFGAQLVEQLIEEREAKERLGPNPDGVAI